ncbi:pentatricopeptide repeat-containing protein At2g35030, mitochondrial-like [Selaginella moellendorffii]|uniref:pentatricopeptide repeat-containing protein At2g35030, mitochondrial-like n=1 Tax=Selaginella moellendorffii TaxID=88036 RepID=UPI000D1C68EC|nr:pentatricopeptide repeat-containing protein At2g35030, mitochondrial-like [Selaginella moellendorffii]|eukprot:XP_024536766.1 pentatricopeptide repeat-containing protein At2g35030, mitochondrial-like [Selaginella moellendorffii]
MYSKLGCIAEAREVFDRIGKEEKSVVSWTAMMMGCNENGEETLELCNAMAVLPTLGLLSQRSWPVLDWPRKLMGVTRPNILRRDERFIHKLAAFQRMQRLDVVSWNALILGHVENGENERALEILEASRNARTFVAALIACPSLAAKEAGKQVDGRV